MLDMIRCVWLLLRIGITGGSGFIGTHVANVLKSKYEVMIFDHHKPKIEDIEEFVRQLVDESLSVGFVPMTSFFRSHQAKQYGFLNSNADVVCFSDEDLVFTDGFFDKIYDFLKRE